jgi:thiol-disulfide isomerase/thioredoxin
MRHCGRRINGIPLAQILLLGAFVFFGVSVATFPSEAGDKIGHVFTKLAHPFPAPEIAFTDPKGNHRGFIEFRGKVVVAYVWATWCLICAIDMPNLDRLQEKLNSDDTAVIPLSIDRAEIQVVQSYFEQKGIRFLQPYQDRDSILASVLGARGTPTAFLIDRAGFVIGVSEGAADWNAPETEKTLTELSRSRK